MLATNIDFASFRPARTDKPQITRWRLFQSCRGSVRKASLEVVVASSRQFGRIVCPMLTHVSSTSVTRVTFTSFINISKLLEYEYCYKVIFQWQTFLVVFAKVHCLLFCMGVKLGRWHWGTNVGWGCLRIGCWGEYLGLQVSTQLSLSIPWNKTNDCFPLFADKFKMYIFRLPPRSSWELRSSGLFRSEQW